MLEFGKSLEELNARVEASRKSFRRGWASFYIAEKIYGKAVHERRQILQDILQEKGLAVCSGVHTDFGGKFKKDSTAEQLGIYPRSQMKLLYYERGPYAIRGEYEDSTGSTESLKFLCPECFPKDHEWHFRKDNGYTSIESEVTEKDGKYTLVVNGYDITDVAAVGGRDIELNGMKPFVVKNEIFRYFGIPDLPEEPNLNNIQSDI
jgi:hypothetical protein